MGKRINNIKKDLDLKKKYTIEEAVSLIKKNGNAKFDETVELHLRLGIDVKKSDQQVRNTVSLPNGTGKTKRVAVIAKGEKEKEAKDSGADIYGNADLNSAWLIAPLRSSGRYVFPSPVLLPDGTSFRAPLLRQSPPDVRRNPARPRRQTSFPRRPSGGIRRTSPFRRS